ncbi:unnamed protein product [Closterium sp. Yama58-4]|nr:unnamed protein product [Closterium sp. Yama58-4]
MPLAIDHATRAAAASFLRDEFPQVLATAAQLVAVEDPETEPYRSKYAAAAALDALRGKADMLLRHFQPAASHHSAAADAADAAREDAATAGELLDAVAVLEYKSGAIAADVDEVTRAKGLLMRAHARLHLNEPKHLRPLIDVCNLLGLLASNDEDHKASLAFLVRAHKYYHHFLNLQSQAAGEAAATDAMEEGGGSERGGDEETREVESLHTITTFYLAQTLAAMGKKQRAAAFCAATLTRQLRLRQQFRAWDWAQNCAQLAGDAPAGTAPSGAAGAAAGGMDVDGGAREGQQGGDVDMGEGAEEQEGEGSERWAGEGDVDIALGPDFSLLGLDPKADTCARMLADGGDAGGQKGEGRGVEGEGEADVVREYSHAVIHFNKAMTAFKAALEVYTSTDRFSDHFDIAMDISTLHRYLAYYEPSAHRAALIHQRRATRLLPLATAINPSVYPTQAAQCVHEVASIALNVMELEADAARPPPKIIDPAKQAIQYFERFIALMQSSTPQGCDDVRFVYAHFHIARTHYRICTLLPPQEGKDHLQHSLNYFSKFLEHAARVGVQEQLQSEVAVAKEMQKSRLPPVNSPGAGERQLRALAEGTRQGGLGRFGRRRDAGDREVSADDYAAVEAWWWAGRSANAEHTRGERWAEEGREDGGREEDESGGSQKREAERGRLKIRVGECSGAVKGEERREEWAQGPLREGEVRRAQAPVARRKVRTSRQRSFQRVDAYADVARSRSALAREAVQGDGAREACGVAGGQGLRARWRRGSAPAMEQLPGSSARDGRVARALRANSFEGGRSGWGEEGAVDDAAQGVVTEARAGGRSLENTSKGFGDSADNGASEYERRGSVGAREGGDCGNAGPSRGAGERGADTGSGGCAAGAGGARSGPAMRPMQPGRQQQQRRAAPPPHRRASRRLQPGEVRSLARQLHSSARCVADVDAMLAAAVGERGEGQGGVAEAEGRGEGGAGPAAGERGGGVWVHSGVVVALMQALADLHSWRAALLVRSRGSLMGHGMAAWGACAAGRADMAVALLTEMLERCTTASPGSPACAAPSSSSSSSMGLSAQPSASPIPALSHSPPVPHTTAQDSSPPGSTGRSGQSSGGSKRTSRHGCWPSEATFGAVMHALCKAGRVGDAEAVLRVMARVHVRPNAIVFNTLLSAAAAALSPPAAAAATTSLDPAFDVYQWGSIGSSSSSGGARGSDAVGRVQRVLAAMRAAGVAPTAATVTAVMAAHAARGDDRAVLHLWDAVTRGGWDQGLGEGGVGEGRSGEAASKEGSKVGREGMQGRWGVSAAAGAPAARYASAEAACAGDAASAAEQARCMVRGRHAAVVPDAPMVTLVLGAMARLRLVPAAESLWALAEASQPRAVHNTGGAGGDVREGCGGGEWGAEEGGSGEVEGYVWRSKREGRRARREGGPGRWEGGGGEGDSREESEWDGWQRGRERGGDGWRGGGGVVGEAAWGRLDGMAAAAMVGVYVAVGDVYHAMRFLLSAAAARLLPTPGMALAVPRAPTQTPPHSPEPATSGSSTLPPAAAPDGAAARPAMSPTPLNMVLAALQQASQPRHMDALLLCYLHSPSPAFVPPHHPTSLDSPSSSPRSERRHCEQMQREQGASAQAVAGPGGAGTLYPAACSCLPMPSHPAWARLPWDCPHCLRRRAARAAVRRGWGRAGSGWLEEWEGEYGVRVNGGGKLRSEAATRGERVGGGEDGHGAVGGGAGCCCCSSSGVVLSKGTCEVMAAGYGKAGMHERAAAVVLYMEEQGHRVAPHLLSLLPHD